MSSSSTFTDRLLAAKVPQLLGTYLAVGFGLLQFVEFVVNRYTFDSVWVDRYLLLWLGLVPAVALLIYYGGLPHRNRETGAGWKSGLVATNLILVLGALFLLVSGPRAGATEMIAFTDADGKATQRVIPARSAVQRIAVFGFQRENGADDWWGTAYGLLLNEHLRQRPELINVSPMELANHYESFGAPSFGDINVATQRKIAQRTRTDYFVNATYEITETGHEVAGSLHRTRDGKAVQQLAASAEDVYGVIDRLKEQIDDYLPPLGDLDKVETMLPSSALITDKVSALEAYTRGNILFHREPDKPEIAADFFRKSVAEDPACAACFFSLGMNAFVQGKIDSARLLMRDAVRLAEVLPEREQFIYKTMLVSLNNETESTIKILDAFRRLYPYDWFPYQYLEQYYEMSYGIDSAIVLMNAAAELSNREKALERLYSLYSKAENFPEVERIIAALEAEFPDEDGTLIRKARLYRKTGRTEEAREVLEEMVALDPLNADPARQLINLELGAGAYQRAEQLARKSLRQASTATDSVGFWDRLIAVHYAQGRIEEAWRELEQYEDFLSRRSPRLIVLMQGLNKKIGFSLLTGNYAKMDAALDELAAYDADRGAVYRCLTPYNMAVFGASRPGLREQFASCGGTLESIGPMADNITELTRLLLDEDYGAAADLVEARRAEGVELAQPFLYARIFRLADRPEKARELLAAEMISQPKDPLLHLELARLELAAGNQAGARKSLDIALEAYQRADADYLPARSARELRDQLAS